MNLINLCLFAMLVASTGYMSIAIILTYVKHLRQKSKEGGD